jgi:intracellular sulfur oxidation DsrE/DsrF family protein
MVMIMISRIRHIASMAMVSAVALLAVTTLASAGDSEQSVAKSATVGKRVAKPEKSSAATQAQKPAAVALVAPPAAAPKEHHLILQVNSNDAAAMNLALNNATNVAQYYEKTGEPVKIEVVAFGPGLHMLRDDTSPVKARIETMALSTPEVSFKACGVTEENMRKAENKDIPIIPQAQMVKSGVVHIMELEEQGWTYVKP